MGNPNDVISGFWKTIAVLENAGFLVFDTTRDQLKGEHERETTKNHLTHIKTQTKIFHSFGKPYENPI